MPALFAGTQSSPDRHARVITTSSSAAICGHIDFASFKDGPARRKHSKEALYAQSKLVRRGSNDFSSAEMRHDERECWTGERRCRS